jgi:hypothetical protein
MTFTSTVSPANRHDRKSQRKIKVFPYRDFQVMAGAQKENSRTGILPVVLGGGASRQAFPGRSPEHVPYLFAGHRANRLTIGKPV